MNEKFGEIMGGLTEILEQIDEEAPARMAGELLKARRVYITGAGSSASIGNIFARRLAHFGMNVYYTDQAAFPPLSRGDVLVVFSGSGETLTTTQFARAAKELKTRVLSITSYPDSSLGKLSDAVVVVRGRESIPEDKDFFSRQLLGEYEPLTPSGIIFEIAALIFLEGVVSLLAEKRG